MTATGVGVSAVKPQPDTVNIPTNRYGVTSWSRSQGNINPGRPVPSNFRCSICKKTGHAKNVCPEAHLIPKSEERHQFPSGIPKTNLRPAQPGDKFAMLGPDGYVVSDIEQKAAQIKKKDKPSFMDDDDESKGEFDSATAAGATVSKIPQELKCPYGDHLLKDAVIIPCCGHFVCCDQCIREKISNDEVVECPNEACDQEIGSLTTITPFVEMRRKVNDYLNDLKLANQRAQLGLVGSTGIDKKSSSDAFFDLIMSGVDETSQSALIKTSPIINAEINEESNHDELNKENKNQEPQQIKIENDESNQVVGNESPSAIETVSSPSGEFAQLTESSVTKSTTILSTNNENQKQINSKIEHANSKQYSSNNVTSIQSQQPALLPVPPQMNPIIPTQMPPYTRPPLYTSDNFMQRPPNNIINPMQG